MKRYGGRLVLCIALFLCVVLISMAFAEMKKVDDKELARASASVIGPESRKTTPAGILVSNNGVLSQPANKATESFSLNLTAGPETWTYSFSESNPNYWGGSVSGIVHRSR